MKATFACGVGVLSVPCGAPSHVVRQCDFSFLSFLVELAAAVLLKVVCVESSDYKQRGLNAIFKSWQYEISTV